MEERLAQAPRKALCEKLLSDGPDFFEPLLICSPKFSLQLSSETLRKGRAVSAGRNRNLQGSAAYHGAIVEVRMLGIVDDVAQNPKPFGLRVDPRVERWRGCCGYQEKCAPQIGRAEFSGNPADFGGIRPRSNSFGGTRCNNPYLGFRAQQSLNLFLGNSTAADDKAAASGEFQKGRKEEHSSNFFRVARLLGSKLLATNEIVIVLALAHDPKLAPFYQYFGGAAASIVVRGLHETIGASRP